MKLNGTLRHYMPLSQSQSDDDENVPKQPDFGKGFSENLNLQKSFNPQLYITKGTCQDPKHMPMSPLRTLAFVISLCLCVLFIMTLSWLLPCEPITEKTLLEEWSIVLQNISLTSDIAVARTSSFSSPLLIFGFSQMVTESQHQFGVIALWKSDGEKKWQLNLHFEVKSLLCNSIDVNKDGCIDCLVIGNNGLITAVDIKTGKNLWYLHSHKFLTFDGAISTPTVLLDCNGDLIPELAVSYTFTDTKSAFMGLISGGTGEIIGSAVPIPHCVSPVIAHLSMNWKNKTTFVFYCIDGKTGYLFLSYANDFCDVAMNRSSNMKITTLYRALPFYSEVQFYKVSEYELAVILNGTKCILLEMNSKESLKPKWMVHFKDGLKWRAATHGSFVPGETPQLVLISSGAKVIGLQLNKGNRMWSAAFPFSAVTSAFSLPHFFRDTDGIMLKMVKNESHMMPGEMANDTNNRSIAETNDKVLQIDGNLHMSEECYILLHHDNLQQFTKINVQDIWYSFKDSTYHPDIYTRKETAVATVLNNEEVDMAVSSTSLIPSNSSRSVRFETTVSLLKLEKFSQLSKCIYKTCI